MQQNRDFFLVRLVWLRICASSFYKANRYEFADIAHRIDAYKIPLQWDQGFPSVGLSRHKQLS